MRQGVRDAPSAARFAGRARVGVRRTGARARHGLCKAPVVDDRFEANLRALAARDRGRAAAIAAASARGTVEATPTGEPTLVVDGVLIHSRLDPVREATAWAARQRDRLTESASETAVVFGFGLGYHVEALATVWSGPIVVVEPDAGLLRAALAARDLRTLLARVTIAPEPLADDAVASWGALGLLTHAPSLLAAGAALRGLRERLAARAALQGVRLHVLVVSPLGGGSHPLTGYCARALAELGHTVSVLDLAPFASGMEAIARFTPKAAARRKIEAAYIDVLGGGVLAAIDAAAPDLVLAMAQAPVPPSILEAIARRGVLRAFWFVEDQRLFTYWRDVLGGYDHFFAIQQGAFLAEAQRLAPGRVHYLPCAADPAVHRPLALTNDEKGELGAPVSFVGAGYRNRRLAFRSLLDVGLRIWGSDWGGAGALEPAIQRDGARIATDDAVRIFNATAVNLNLHSSTFVDGVEPRGDFVNPRTFEIAAAGAFQLVDRRSLLPSLFVPDAEVATFTNTDDLRDLVDYWVERPEERAAIAAAGRRRVLAEHTYRHRMATLLDTIAATDGERLATSARRARTMGDIARVEAATPLGDFLRTLPPALPFTFDGLAQGVFGREGALSEAESILLFLHQFDQLYVHGGQTA